MPFQNPLLGWNVAGVEPPQSLKDVGWEATQKPPAAYFNWTFYLLDQALAELQQNAIHQEKIGVAGGIAKLNAEGKPLNADGTLAGEVTQNEFSNHTGNTTIHITDAERIDWNAKETPSGAQEKVNTHENKTNNPHGVTAAQTGAEPAFSKNTAFNKNFGATAGTVAEGNHSHTAAEVGAEPAFTKNTAFNKDFGTTAGTVADGGDLATHQADEMPHQFTDSAGSTFRYGFKTNTNKDGLVFVYEEVL
ncbi:hypothetical protein [Virgibacillus sediminis]|uniref:Tail fiber protein n=1 Tax=Virgibacillus sediminis TaxID=202260 RepID=A0ABV7A6F5_9BACI